MAANNSIEEESYSEVDLNDEENSSIKPPVSSKDVNLRVKNQEVSSASTSMSSTTAGVAVNSHSDQNNIEANDSGGVLKNGEQSTNEETIVGKIVVPPLSDSTERIAAIVASETNEQTFKRLKNGIEDGSASSKEVVNSVFQVVSFLKNCLSLNFINCINNNIKIQLVGGPFDVENKFIIQNSRNIGKMVELLDVCPSPLKVRTVGQKNFESFNF